MMHAARRKGARMTGRNPLLWLAFGGSLRRAFGGQLWLVLGSATLWFCCACTSEAARNQDTEHFVRYPVALAADPSGRFVFALGANFDRSFRAGVLKVVDTASDTFVAKDGVEIPSFGAGLAVQLAGSPTPTAVRLLATSREDDSLTLVDLSGAVTPTLYCGIPDANGVCDSAHHYVDTTNLPIGNDPVDVAIAPLDATHVRVHVAATADGRVTILDMDTAPSPHKLPLTMVDHLMFGFGVNGVRVSPLTGRAYVSNNSTNALYTYRVDGDGTTASPYTAAIDPTIILPSGGGGEYGRGMALSTDGGRLYLAYRSPASIIVVDIAPMENGLPRNGIIDVIGVGRRPSEIAVAPTGPGGSDLLYVSCFGEDAVWVVDPQRSAVVGTIRLKHAPYGLAATRVPGAKGWQLYAGLFDLNEIAVIPLVSHSSGATSAVDFVKEAP